jgi:hypothetical protein
LSNWWPTNPPSEEVTLSTLEELVTQASREIEVQVMQELVEGHEEAATLEQVGPYASFC